ncbi:formin-binding protein 1-like isoform X3 [Planococcus citri]|uniref:formin-binding protein 1-like isoform X3 n=1 Tax=Planococcus citri TaxID=170843 RepID=UPI0031F95396
MSWGTELWDQYENLSLHTQKGIEFLERYSHFIRDRCAIEMEYAAKLRRLVKNYQPKKKEEEDYQFTSCRAFKKVMGEVTDLAGQHEVIAENLQSDVIREITCLVKDFKEERKKYLQDGARCMTALSSQIAALERAKKNYEKASREAERALDNFQRADADFNLSRAEVEKQRINMSIKNQHCDESKNEYASQLQKTNELQYQHYQVLMPEIFRQLQELDEKRIRNIRNFMAHSAEVERKVFPIINQCLDGIVNAANEINEKDDMKMVIEKYKSGFQPPEDIPFEDLSREGDSSTSKGSVISAHTNHGLSKPEKTIKGTLSGSKHKKRGVLLGIFGSNKKLMDVCQSVKNNIPSLYGDHKEDFNDLPPNQRMKKLQQRIDEIQTKIQQESATRDGLMKMKGVYEQNPALGDPMSIEGQLNESSHRLDKLRIELKKFQDLLEGVERNSPAGKRKNSYTMATTNGVQQNGNHDTSVTDGRRNSSIRDEGSLSRSASDSSMTAQNNMKINHKQNSPNSTMLPSNNHGPESGISTSHTSLPDAGDFPEYYDAPELGTCRALYPFEATSEGSIPMYDGEELLIIELDQGDGWTRVRRRNDNEEGFVPTSYIECNVYNS